MKCVVCGIEFIRRDNDVVKCAVCRINSIETGAQRHERLISESINPSLKNKRYFSKD